MGHHGNLWQLLWQLPWQLLGSRWHLLLIDAIIDAIIDDIKDDIAMAPFNLQGVSARSFFGGKLFYVIGPG